MGDHKAVTARKLNFRELWPNQRNKKKPEISTDDTTITLAGSDKKLKRKSASLSGSERLKLSCERLKGFFSKSKNYFDEVELRKKGLTNNEINKRKMSSIGGQTKRSKERIQRGSYYGVNNLDPSAENYITDAEINTRGYVDRNGQIHYSIPIFPKATESKHIAKKTGHVFISSENSERSIHSYTSNSKSELGDEKGTILGVITCSVGDSTDRGKLDYKVCDNGRIYELKCSNGPSMVLSFSKKNAALVTNWYKNDNLSLS